MDNDVTVCKNASCPNPDSFFNVYHNTGYCIECCQKINKHCAECYEDTHDDPSLYAEDERWKYHTASMKDDGYED